MMEAIESPTFSSDFIEEFPSLVWGVEEYFEDIQDAIDTYDKLRRVNKYVRVVKL